MRISGVHFSSLGLFILNPKKTGGLWVERIGKYGIL